MHELLPILLGAIFGTAAAAAPLPGPRSAWFVGGCIVAGALGSWINGELASSLAALFLSFDALLAWCGGAAAFLGLRYYARMAAP
ncbi:MAG: hypothetical protein K0S78_3157 [Thermomicrobiales bacterium]|jgi:hypothetical protein|nr:hypothetical protein [Thermomicrobiales bacterium]